jgi:homoserine O-acetyltransferase
MDLRLHCRTLGSQTQSGGNVVLMLHGTTGSGIQFLRPETADFLFGPGQPLDATKYYILLPDAIGHGLSSKPSDGAGTEFPKYGYGDIVRAQHLLVTEHFGLNHLRLVLGTSMGGMQTWMWGQAYPKMMDALMPIASLPARLTGRNLLIRRIMIAMIKSDPGYHEGPSNDSRPIALGAAWNLFRLLVDSPARLAEVFNDVEAADEHVRSIAANAMETEDANDVIWEFEASRDYDPADKLTQIEAPLLAVNFADDELNPQNLNVLSRAILEVARGRAVTIPAGARSRGHQTLQVAELWAHLVGEVLEASSATEEAK